MKVKIISRDTEKEFDEGYDLALKLVDDLGDISKGEPSSNHLAGIITCILNFTYAFAPNEEAVDALVAFAKEMAIDDSRRFKEDGNYKTGEVKSKFVQH